MKFYLERGREAKGRREENIIQRFNTLESEGE